MGPWKAVIGPNFADQKIPGVNLRRKAKRPQKATQRVLDIFSQKVKSEEDLKRFLNYLIPRLGYLLIALLLKTYRFKKTDFKQVRQKIHQKTGKENCVVVFWHEDILGGLVCYAGQNFNVLVSKSKDGDLINYVIEKLKFKTVRGSSSRGSSNARNVLNEKLQKGENIAIPVDGPRGPRHVIKKGAILLAQMNDVAIVPLGFAYTKPIIFKKSWDKFKLPLPFSKICCLVGEPVFFEKENFQLEEEKSALQKKLVDLSGEAEKILEDARK
jgi:lysophospholipid acyltransferase (LPLAT)-like uncharacterized protein